MKQNHADAPKEKGNVKFKMSDSEDDDNLSEASKPENKSMVYSNIDTARSYALKTFNECDTLFRNFTENDPFAKKSDTVSGIVMILRVLEHLSKAPQNDKEELFHLVYNCSLYIFDYCRVLRKSIYGLLCIPYLKEVLIGMESNIVLLKSKYLEWRVKIYIEIIRIYEENGSLKCALELSSRAADTIKKQKDLEELDPPVPDYSRRIYHKCQHYLNSLMLKFQLQSGELKIDQLKVKLKDYFPKEEDNKDKLLTLIELLSVNNKNHNLLSHDGKKSQWKEQLVEYVYDTVKEDLNFMVNYIEKRFKDYNDRAEFMQTMRTSKHPTYAENDEDQPGFLKSTNEERLDLLAKELKSKKISDDFPLQLHFELLKHAYDTEKHTIFADLLTSAFKRCDYRRIEVPYISDIDFEVSNDMDVNVRNGYDKIAVDLNEAYLKQEITKLRNKRQNEAAEEDEEEAKGTTAGKKGKAGPGGQGKKKDETEVDAGVEGQWVVTSTGFKFKKKELEKIKHQFTYLIMKRTPNPRHAIYDIQIVVGDEHRGPTNYIEQGWKCVAIPIEQYTGVRATYHTIPYLCFKQSETGLKEEDQKKTILSDIRPILSKSSLVRPDYGFTKLDTDLRQVPKEFGRMSNIDYVFFSYKTDGEFFKTERLTYILDALYRLENTFGKLKITDTMEEARELLMANFGFDEFRNLADVLKRSLEGPLGDQLLTDEYDLLFKISFHLWQTYISPLIVQIDHFYYLKAQGELLSNDQSNMSEIIDKHIVPSFIDLLEILLKIAESNAYEQDIIWICKMTLELGKLLEQTNKFKEAAQILRTAFDRIVSYRDEKLQRRLRSRLDLLLPFSLTCSNYKIQTMFEQMKVRYFEWKLSLERTIRRTRREKAKKRKLKPREEDEEEDEVLRYTKQFHNDDFRDEPMFEKIAQKQVHDFDMIVNALHVDISVSLLRNEVNDGVQREKMKTAKNDAIRANNKDEVQLIKEQQGLQGIAYNLIRKINLMNEPNSQSIYKNAKSLQYGMQKAGMIDHQKPEFTDYEKKLIREASDNCYLSSLLYIVLAMNRTSESEQQQLLTESFNKITQCESLEERLIEEGIKNSPEILSTLFEDKLLKQSADKVHPFSAMIKEDYISETKCPRTPILLCKTSTSMIFKLPVFKPKIPEEILMEDPRKGTIASMALFGKRANNTAVSATSSSLSNTGIHYPMNSLVRIPNLSHNSKYSFAVAAYDLDENLSNQIGETTLEIHTSQPLPVNLLYNYLAKVAFQLEDTDTALKAAKQGCEMFLEKSLVRERLLNNEFHPVMQYRLNPAKLRQISGLELRSGAETLIIWSLCLGMIDPERNKRGLNSNPNIVRDKQKEVLEISNLRLLAIEMAVPCQAFDLVRIAILEIYNSMGSFFRMKSLSRLIFQILSKVNMALSLVPQHYWDSCLRKVSAKLSYQLIRLSLQLNEFYFSKRVLYTEIKMPRRKYGLKSSVQMVEYIDPAKVKKGAPAAKPKKQTDAVEEEEKKMVPQFTRELLEKNSYQPYFEEFLLTVHEDYYNFADYFQDYWTEHLNSLTDKLSSDEKITAARTELNRVVEFYSMFFDVSSMKSKIEAASGKSERFIEYLSKLGRKLIEVNSNNELTKDIRKQISEYKVNRRPDESNDFLDQYKALKFRAFENNVDWNPAGINKIIEEEQIIQSNNRVGIDIFTEFFELQEKLIPRMEQNWPQFRFTHLWNSEICYLNAACFYLMFKQTKSSSRVTSMTSACDIFELDIIDVQAAISKEKISISENRSNVNDTHMDARSMAPSVKSTTSGDARGILRTLGDDQKDFSESQLELLDKILEFLGEAALCSLVARSYRQLQNILLYTQNILNGEVIRPIEIAKRDSWRHLVLLVDCGLKMIEDVKANKGFFDNDEVNVFGDNEFRADFFRVVKDNDKAHTVLEPLEEKKKFWFLNLPQLKIKVVANLVGFVSQVLLVKEKWNVLISLTKTLSNVTSHYFSRYTLPFTIAAQDVLVGEATDKKNAKLEDLRICNERFKLWLKSREKSRQAKLNLQKSKEQQQYDVDKQILVNQIENCTFKEKNYRQERDNAMTIKKEIESEVKESLKDLRQLQRNVAQLATADRRINEAIRMKIFSENELNRKGLIKEAENYIKLYKNLIDGQMRRKKEIFLATVALHDLGNLYYAIGDIKQATISWSEGIDEVFQKSNSLKGFRDILVGSAKTVQSYGMRELLIVVILLGKLALYSFYNDVSSKRDCLMMACCIAKDMLKISLEHPQGIKDLAIYSLSNLGVEDLFSERKYLNASDLLFFSSELCSQALDFELNFEAIPLICISEYLANYHCNSAYFSARSKLHKCLALSNIGMISEAIVNLLRVYYEKDFPIMDLFKNSESLKLKVGVNYSFSQDMQYQNDLTPNDTRNSGIVTKIFDLKLTDEQSFKLGPNNGQLFNLARVSLLYGLLRLENLDIPSYVELRRTKLEEIQEIVGDSIKRLIFEEKLSIYQAASDLNVSVVESDHNTEGEDKNKSSINQAMAYFITNSSYSSLKDSYMKINTAGLSLEDLRRQRTTLIVQLYLLQSKILVSLNGFTFSYSFLKDCLTNLQKLSTESPDMEYTPPAIEEVEETGQKGGKKIKDEKKPEAKKPAPAAAKKKPGKGVVEEEFTEDQFAEVTEKITSQLRKINSEAETQRGVQSHLWLRVKSELANSLFLMKRWTALLDFISVLANDSAKLNDTWYKRKSMQLQCRVQVILGHKSEAIHIAQEISEAAKKHKDSDVDLGIYFADLGEFYFHEGNYQEALNNFKSAKNLILAYLRNYITEFDFSNVNDLFKTETIVSELIENKYDIEQKLGRERIEKGGKGGKGTDNKNKKKDEKKQAGKDAGNTLNNDIGTLFPMSVIAPLKDQKLTMINPEDQQETSINSSTEYVCIYSQELELYTKINHRICETLLLLNSVEPNGPQALEKKDELESTIEAIHKMNAENSFILRKNYFINTSFKMANEYFIGKSLKFEAIFKFAKLQAEIVKEHLEGNRNERVKKILDHLPNKSFSLNRFIIKVPMFTKFIREEFLPLLEKAKSHLLRSIGFLKGECLLQEFDFDPSSIFFEMAEINMLMAEYRPNLGYRFVSNDEIRQYGLIKGHKTLLQDQHIYDRTDLENAKDRDMQTFLLWEGLEYLKTSIQATKIKQKMREEYNKLGEDSNETFSASTSKMNKDLMYEILEARRLVESEKNWKNPFPKTKISKVDLITFLLKLHKECTIFSFQNSYAQKQIIKLHKFLMTDIKSYSIEFPVENYEVKSNNISMGDGSTDNLMPARVLAVKSRLDMLRHEYAFMYILGKIDESMVDAKKSMLKEQSDYTHITQNASQPLQGYFHASKKSAEDLLLSFLELKKQMQVSDSKKDEEAKVRDYKLHEARMVELLQKVGLLFCVKSDPFKVAKMSFKSEQQTEDEIDVFGKAAPFIPKVEVATVDVLIKIFGGQGICHESNDLLILFRNFHALKYK